MKTKAQAVKEQTFVPGKTVHFKETGEYVTFEMSERGLHRLVVQFKGVKTVGCDTIYQLISIVKSPNSHVYVALSEYFGGLLPVEQAILTKRGTHVG